MRAYICAMTRHPLVSVCLSALGLSAAVSAAEERPPILKEAAVFSAPASTPTPAPAAKRPRTISPELAAQLNSLHPKFEALKPAAKPAEATPVAGEAAEPADPDKPKNRIIRLPSYLVQEDRPVTFKERELLTPKAKIDLMYRKHPGLRVGSFWIFRNDGIALAMREEEERLERMKEMADLVSLMSITEQKELKPIVEQTFMRQPDLR